MRPQSSLTNKLPGTGRIGSAQVNRPFTAQTQQPPKFGQIDEEEEQRRKTLLKEDIQKKKNKERFEDRLISIAVNKIQNEKAYEYLIKMGDANEICQKLNKNQTYRVFNSADGSIKCHIYENDQYMKSLTLDEFEREYKNLQALFNKEQKYPVWVVLNDKAKNKKKNTVTQNLSQDKKNREKTKELGKKDRQDLLKECLRDTMNLTKTLKNQ